MADSGFQHQRFLQIVERGRLSARINWQRFINLTQKSYSIYPGRASDLSAPGDPWPVQCHWVLTVPTGCPTCLVLSPGHQGALTPLPDLGDDDLVIHSSAWHQEQHPWNAHQSWKLPNKVGSVPGHTGLSLDRRSQSTIWFLICKTPQKHLQGNRDLPLYFC